MSWGDRFDKPIRLPDETELVTLRDAGDYIANLSKRDQASARWQMAALELLRAAESGHRFQRLVARIAISAALGRS